MGDNRANFGTLTFSELMQFSRKWKTDLRNMSPAGFSRLSLIRINGKLHVFAIAAGSKSSSQTLFSAPIPDDVSDHTKLTNSTTLCEIKMKEVPSLERVVRSTGPSAEFALLCERQRAQVVQGITDLDICEDEILCLAGEQLIRLRYDAATGQLEPMIIAVPEDLTNPAAPRNASEPMDVSETTFGPQNKVEPKKDGDPPSNDFISSAKVCPADKQLVAYVLNKQVYIQKNGEVIHHTSSVSEHETNGVPSYIVQEELERFEGIWWSRTKTRLLYERVNEDKVENAQFGVNGGAPSQPMKYPRCGTTNSTSQLRMVIVENDNVYDFGLNDDVLIKKCPGYEYITRAGFFSDGESVWVQMMNRDQSECTLILVPFWDFDLPEALKKFAPLAKREGLQLSGDLNMGHWADVKQSESMVKPPTGKLLHTVLIHRYRSDHWVNTHNAIYPLPINDAEHPKYEFIYCLEKPHGSVLSLVSAELDSNGFHRHSGESVLMAENYSINKSIQIAVDEKRELVYFVANESHPTEWNVCVSHYRTKEHKMLTKDGISFKSERANQKLAVDPDCGFACFMTGLGAPPQCRFYTFKWTKGDPLPDTEVSAHIFITGREALAEHQADAPEMVEYCSKKTGIIHYGLVLRPAKFDSTKKYPVFQYVYGGPGIQTVHNDYSWIQFVRFARLGYVVVIVDNRGSANRGIDFEAHLSRKMGTVEVEDQVEGLHILAEQTGKFMDLTRVVVQGWSYGGYMALQMLAKHPNVYCAAIAGGAVSDWRLYDTAYTERYMGHPVIDIVYSKSSITQLVDRFPDEPNRLMLVHGLMDENVHFSHLTKLLDECIKQGKFHELLVFPQERHGIRNTDASIYLDARMMYFAQTALNNCTIAQRSPQREANN